jgi:hypothetical protein
MRAICPAHLIFHYIIILIILREAVGKCVLVSWFAAAPAPRDLLYFQYFAAPLASVVSEPAL